jgi:multidrug resistance efflux pump
MIAFLTLCYCGLVWLIFLKLKLLPWNRGSQFGVVAVGISGVLALLVAMSLYQPYSTDVRLYNLVVEIVPRVTGRVIDVPVEGGDPVEKGAVLFRVDPRPFEYEVKRLRADLMEARANRRLAKAEYERNQRARRTGAVSQSDVDAARAREEALVGAIGSREAQMEQAEWDLEEATVYAPSKGVVTNLTLRPGQVASKMAGQPVMTFVSGEAPRIVATFPPNALRHIRVGDLAEIALDRHPGKILNARVATLVDISAQGQLAPSGDIPDWTDVEPTSRFAIRFELEEESSRFALPGGAGGAAAIYTDKAKAIRIVRKVVIRMYTWLNYFF